MKKFLAMILALVMVLAMVSVASAEDAMRVAMITDYGDITDQSFNQTTYEACKKWAEENGVDFTYFKPAGDSTPERVAMVEKAAEEGYNVIVMPGFAFGEAVRAVAEEYSDITFIALDVSESALGFENGIPANVYSAVYQEELCGYMVGYAAVKLGYEKLGFLGGMAVPAVVRYGYGFVQGADAAATELEKTDKVTMKYAYGDQFYGDADITAVMDTWYNDGTEVVFACGGSIYSSAAEAAAKVGGKVIGVDVDQIGIIDGQYGEGMTVTSAMKGLALTVKTLLASVMDGTFEGGKVETLGLVSENPEENYVQIPMTTQFDDNFTAEDYAALVAGMFKGEIVVSADTETEPVSAIAVDYQGNIK